MQYNVARATLRTIRQIKNRRKKKIDAANLENSSINVFSPHTVRQKKLKPPNLNISQKGVNISILRQTS